MAELVDETSAELDEENVSAENSEEETKKWLFQEQVRIQARRDELMEFNRELTDMKLELDREKTKLDDRERAIKKRYDDNEILIAKKLKIIEDAYRQMEVEKKAIECERINLEHEKSKYRKQRMSGGARSNVYQYGSADYDGTSFFRGVDGEMALRKRYKELLKIFHPDNKCGDTKTLLKIQSEYEGLRSKYSEG